MSPATAMGPGDELRWKYIASARISPDGKKVVYVIVEFSKDSPAGRFSLWLIRLDRDRTPLRLTKGPHDFLPRWAPDSRRIAFVSFREEAENRQLYVIDTEGGEAQRIKTDNPPQGPPSWSPDGQKLAFIGLTDRRFDHPRYPGEPPELLPIHSDGRDPDAEFELLPKVITEVDYRQDDNGFIYQLGLQLFVADLEEDACHQLTDAKDLLYGDFVWNARGTTLIYSVRHRDRVTLAYRAVVREVNLVSGSDCRLFTFDGAACDFGLTADGSALLFCGWRNRLPAGASLSHIWRVPLTGHSFPLDAGNIVDLTPDLDRDCQDLIISPHDGSLLFLVEAEGTLVPCRLSPAGGLVEPADSVGLATTTVLDVAANGMQIHVSGDFITPQQIYLLKSDETVRLTNLNADLLEEFPPCPAEKFAFKGADGWDIEGWVVRPSDYVPGRRYPGIVVVHGGPNAAYLDVWDVQAQVFAQHGFAVIMINPRGSTGYGEKFEAACDGDWGGKDYQDIMAGLDKVIDMGIVDGNRVGITGWSYGGYMTCWAITQTDRFRAAVGGGNITNIYTLFPCSDGPVDDVVQMGKPTFDIEELCMARSPMRHVRYVKTPILLLHGESDLRCPIEQSDQFFIALKRLRKEVVFVRYPSESHSVATTLYRLDSRVRTLAWFKHYLLDQP